MTTLEAVNTIIVAAWLLALTFAVSGQHTMIGDLQDDLDRTNELVGTAHQRAEALEQRVGDLHADLARLARAVPRPRDPETTTYAVAALDRVQPRTDPAGVAIDRQAKQLTAQPATRGRHRA